MTQTPTDDQPGFIAEQPEHCHACYRLIRAGETYYLTIEDAWLCANCIVDKDAIRVADDLVVVTEKDMLVVRRGDASVAVLLGEARHLADGPADGVAKLVGRSIQEAAGPYGFPWVPYFRGDDLQRFRHESAVRLFNSTLHV